MKTKAILALGAIVCILCACNNKPNNKETSILPGACMCVVKFPNSEQMLNVIASHEIIDYDGINGHYVYDTVDSVGLNIIAGRESQYSFTQGLHDGCLENEMTLPGSSPYIPLVNGYYLIDWKWQILLPLSATCDYPEAGGNDMREMADNHCFLTDKSWDDLTSVNQRWENSQELQPVHVDQIMRIGYASLDSYSGKELGLEEFYNTGLSAVAVLTYLQHPEFFPQDSDCQALIARYNNIQNICKDKLIQIIRANQLDRICVIK